MTVFYGARDSLDEPRRPGLWSRRGPFALFALAVGMLCGVALRVVGI